MVFFCFFVLFCFVLVLFCRVFVCLFAWFLLHFVCLFFFLEVLIAALQGEWVQKSNLSHLNNFNIRALQEGFHPAQAPVQEFSSSLNLCDKLNSNIGGGGESIGDVFGVLGVVNNYWTRWK